MRRILALAFLALFAFPGVTSAGTVYGYYVPDAVLDEYRWEGPNAFDGRWIDKTCDTETFSFTARLWMSINEGGYEVKICGNESNLCDVPMDPPGTWNTDPCNTPGDLDDYANDEASDVHILYVSSGGKVCLYRDATWGYPYAYLWANQAFHNMGSSSVGNDALSALRWRSSGNPC